MNQQALLKGALVAVVALVLGSTTAWAAAEKQKQKPNILLVMADDQGWGDMGYYDHPYVKTPNFDAMAKVALRFDRFYAAAPICSPTRPAC